MGKKIRVEIDRELHDFITRAKYPGESANSCLRRLTGFDNEEAVALKHARFIRGEPQRSYDRRSKYNIVELEKGDSTIVKVDTMDRESEILTFKRVRYAISYAQGVTGGKYTIDLTAEGDIKIQRLR